MTFKNLTNLFLAANFHVATPCYLVIVNANPTHFVVVVVYRCVPQTYLDIGRPSGRVVF